ncbi:hypothetical protein L598_000400000970 [Mesorhizobium sp. J18]|uniref:hypothetical protein n=1 Tax=Mesorhizobium sp. J18 TaxID=935263 RepID=UPI00119BEF8E|nr:hypothetical protein [Mesorhizobium sp. J18]TWG93824.1 hypothetical protein L598_000400000970 [Mesorhizobium sp. J18]
MFQRARQYAFVPFVAVAAALIAPEAASASDREQKFFESVQGQWSGPGEIVAGKYKGTKFVCNFEGTTPEGKVGMTLDGGCRVGMFTQNMSASVERKAPGEYRGTFMDGAAGKGLDVTGGTVKGKKVVFSLVRNALNGAMLAHLSDKNTMNITVSVRVAEEMVPVIGMNLKRTDTGPVGSVAVAR